jgi:hypothetical protein
MVRSSGICPFAEGINRAAAVTPGFGMGTACE